MIRKLACNALPNIYVQLGQFFDIDNPYLFNGSHSVLHFVVTTKRLAIYQIQRCRSNSNKRAAVGGRCVK